MSTLLKDSEKRKFISLVISLPALIIGFFDLGGLPVNTAWIAILLCGIPILKEAIIGLITEFDIKADVLVSMALIASVITGEIFAAGEIAFIMTIGSYLEERTVSKARAGIESLVHMTPTIARVLRSGKEYIVPVEEVVKGDILRVLPGETITVDGTIIKGETSIDQSPMTGEFLPIEKREGDTVASGTINQFGSFDMRADKIGEDSSIQRMIKLVESADAGKAKIVGLADRFATWVVVIALLSAVITWIYSREIIRSVTILVVFCPCALVLATPTAIMAAIGNASKHGILVREGDALERLSKIKRVAFDKTGTITYGKLKVAGIIGLERITEEELLRMAASLEYRSEHPLGKAVIEHYNKYGKKDIYEVTEFKMSTGRGVEGLYDGTLCYAGNEVFMAEKGIRLSKSLISKVKEVKEGGSTVIYLAKEKMAIGFIILTDTMRPEIEAVVDKIHNTGISTTLLTGDGETAGLYMGRKAGIREIHTECLPENKLAFIQKSEAANENVCMIGDGINDAPALKSAYVGIAMGGIGSDIAIEAADMVLISDDIKEMPHLLTLSKQMMKTINFNLAASMILNFIAIVLAITGVLSPVVGALVHNIGSVAVITNSSFLLRWRKK
ncbi:heavy metal translocating P-type ATPase [Anaerocolumna chitinilytica]|uniref:Cd(2+)-exporting ATPase n=1 Tax=Anaerocolumna chitinilytica TaxID=1727145 RepID=A0A7I8DLH2_9FIRM|nr:cation-translocating P-type ATPase [Anaerocolumna chitinilytica]BCJ99229.1 heavy metal translocating P-type ATPase [Anaerocolumna chitinilytica]